jgi:hypothetical protein
MTANHQPVHNSKFQPGNKPRVTGRVPHVRPSVRGPKKILSIAFPIGLTKPRVPHIPRFPVKLRGFRTPHAPFLKERRTRGLVQGCVQEIRGISLVFREMWDTTNFNLSASTFRRGPWKAVVSNDSLSGQSSP